MHAFDLGHLELLDVLLEEESVSRAAARLHVSASALSRTLGKMRAALGDELLAAHGRALALTPRGLALRAEVKQLVGHAREVLGPRRPLIPAEIDRVFRIRASDYGTAVVGLPLLREVRVLAPRATLSFVPQGEEDIAPFRRGDIDFDLGVSGDLHGELVAEPLFRDRFVCAYAKRSKPRGRLTLDEFCARPHVIASRRAKTFVIIDELLERAAGRRRHVLATAGSFQEALLLAARTDALVAAPLRLVTRLARPLGLRVSPLPLATPDIEVTLTWHARNRDDREHQWLRSQIMRCAAVADPRPSGR
jgi:DNA-binding transcriptional LysR family regulator